MSRRLNSAPPATAVPVWRKPLEMGPHQWCLDKYEELKAARDGDGRNKHQLLFDCAKGFAPYHHPSEIFSMLASAVEHCGRFVPDSEIWDAIEEGAKHSHRPPLGSPAGWVPLPLRQPSRPTAQRDEAAIRAILDNNSRTLADLRNASPTGIGETPSPDTWIDFLFPGDRLLCLGASPEVFATKRREEWRGNLAGCQLIVSSPMSAVEGQTKAGHMSQRCEANVGPRWYAVLEFDSGTKDEQAAIILHMLEALKLPVVLVVDSGGKSLHAWVWVADASTEEVKALYETAARLGCDPATAKKEQMVRLPDGTRHDKKNPANNGNVQRVLYWDHELLAKAMAEQMEEVNA